MSGFEALSQFMTHLVVPLMLLSTVWRARSVSRRRWMANLSIATTYIGYAAVAGSWPTFGYPFRFVLPAVLVAVAAGSAREAAPTASSGLPGDLLRFGVALLFGGMLVWALQGFRRPSQTVTLSFPLRGGIYVVGQGGSTPVLNYHYRDPRERFGVDVVKLHWFGIRASGITPFTVSSYAIFGEEVESPCAGLVRSVADRYPDRVPPSPDPSQREGNFVALDCRGTTVVLAHLRRGSVRVRAGELVREGEVLGAVGNSGNSTEPQLHIHAERQGRSVGILFGGRYLVRNSLIVGS